MQDITESKRSRSRAFLDGVRKHPFLSIGLFILFFFLLASIGGLNSGSSAAQPSETVQTPPPQTPADVVCGMTPQDLKAKAVAVSYKKLVKDPASYQGTFAKFTGQVLQIMQNGDTGVMRLSITDLGDGIWSSNDVVYVEYNRATDAVQGDTVTVYGMLNGTQTYTSQANYQITLPDLVVCSVGSIASKSASASSNGSKSAPAVTASEPPQAAPAPTPSVPASWHAVATFNGSSGMNTATFNIQGTKWRANWSVVPNPGAVSYCQQYSCGANFAIYQDDGSYVDQFQGMGNTSTSGTSYEYGKTGTFYLNVVPGNVSWAVSIEDYY